jgi:hypothetical protein
MKSSHSHRVEIGKDVGVARRSLPDQVEDREATDGLIYVLVV